ncbi:hypothetical protein [Aliarcobacter butzleri]|uniref:hypothetical protein n=1 Tax=Aliarcobacter butzleri TaxID=28197 RepID=UPI0021B1F55C|nr:hypothetical protein [Aliarcobacter butzleri]MCT7647607.1 hypothetical protein [Aliarcobacter butzleri]
MKELRKKNTSSKNNSKIKKEIKTELRKEEEEISFVEEDNKLDKLILNLEEMVDREESETEETNKRNLNFFSTVINNDRNFIKSARDTILLDKEELDSISQKLDLKLGNEISSMVQRVDKDGNIILGMEALKFITGDNIPLITPQGAIRVFNILTIEEDVKLSLETNKPLFVQESKTKKIRRIEKDELESLVITSDEIVNKQLMIKNEKKTIELLERNTFLEGRIEELKNELLKLEGKNEILESITKTNYIIFDKKNIEGEKDLSINIKKNELEINNTKEDNVNKIDSVEKDLKIETTKDDVREKDIVHVEINKNIKEKNHVIKTDNLNPIIEETKIEINKNIKDLEISSSVESLEIKENDKEVENDDKKISSNIELIQTDFGEFNGARIEKYIEQDKKDVITKDINDNLKSLSKKTADSFIEDFFLETLLRRNGGDNKNLKPIELDFITYELEKGTKRYLLRYLYKNTIKKLAEFLKSNDYKDDEKNINLILNNEKILIKDEAYFQSTKDMQLYKSRVIEIAFTQDEIAPYALINEKQNGYRGGLTKEENKKKEESALDKKTIAIYQRNINMIVNNNFKII